MVKYREWLDKIYPNHNNRDIFNIKKIIADEPFEDLADFSMFVDLEELELISTPNIFMGSGTNTKLKMLKIKNASSFNFVNVGGSQVPRLHGEMNLSNLRGLKKLEIEDDSDLQEKAKETTLLSCYHSCYEILVWSKRELESKIISSSTPRIIIVIQTKEGQIAELKNELEKNLDENSQEWLENLLEAQGELTRNASNSFARRQLTRLEERLSKKMDKENIKNLCQIQTELSKLEIDWESLQEEKMVARVESTH